MSTQKQHPIEIQRLFNEQKKIAYPDGVEPVKEMIARNAFFPGGSGLWSTPTAKEWQVLSRLQICRSFFDNNNPVPIIPKGEVMVLGQDFGPKCWHEKYSREEAYDLDSDTWKNLLEYLHCVDIYPKDCFFTNAYMGLMEKGRLKKMKAKEFNQFKKTCKLFLDKQIRMQKPQLILALDEYAIDLIAELSSDGLAKWSPWPGFEKLNDESSWISDVHFRDSEEQPATVVTLVHPGWRSAHVWRRRYRKCNRKFTGKCAELAMLKDALEQSGFQR